MQVLEARKSLPDSRLKPRNRATNKTKLSLITTFVEGKSNQLARAAARQVAVIGVEFVDEASEKPVIFYVFVE